MIDLNESLVIASYLRREAETTTDFRQRERCTDAYKTIESLVAEVERLREQVGAAIDYIDVLERNLLADDDARAAWENVKP